MRCPRFVPRSTLLIVALFPAVARAQEATVLAVPPAMGRAIGRELADWRQATTGAATRFDHACGDLLVRMTLTGRPERNFVVLSIGNSSPEQVTVLDPVRAHFSSGTDRQLKGTHPEEWRIPPGQAGTLPLAFPNKSDFHRQDWLVVEASVARPSGPCQITMRFERDRAVPESRSTVISYHALEASLLGGVTFAHGGSFARVAPPVAADLQLQLAFFRWPSHGFSFDMVVDEWGHAAGQRAAPDLTGHLGLEGLSFLGGYVFRAHPWPWLVPSLEAAAGVGWFSLDQDTSVVRNSSVVPSARLRGRLLVPFWTSWFAGVTLEYGRYFGGHLGPAHFAGGLTGAALVVGGSS